MLSCMLISAETDTGVSTSTTFMVPVQLTDIAENFPFDTVRLIVPSITSSSSRTVRRSAANSIPAARACIKTDLRREEKLIYFEQNSKFFHFSMQSFPADHDYIGEGGWNMTDTAIIELYFSRSEQAIAESQTSYGGYCYRVADGILNDRSDSEECVNDTWLAAWNTIPPTRPQSLKAYFGALTRRISVDRLRKRLADKRGKGEALVALDELAECIPSGWSMETAVENRALIDALNAFLAGCPAAERNLFVARYWYGLPVEELAARFSLKKNTAVSRLRRTRIRLLKYLEKEDLQ